MSTSNQKDFFLMANPEVEKNTVLKIKNLQNLNNYKRPF